MGLRKNKKKSKKSKRVSDYQLPDLPDLPEFPSIDSPPSSSSVKEEDSLPQLPSFPNSSVGNKISENSIKEAVTGGKEVDKEEEDADDFSLPGLPEKPPMMQQEPLKPIMTRPSDEVVKEPKVKEFHKEAEGMTMTEMMEPEQKPFKHREIVAEEEIPPMPRMINHSNGVRKGASAKDDPVFIRIDKFEESLKVFEKTREQIQEIEDLVKHAKDLKIKEEEELSKWEEEIQTIKNQIGKVDKDIFSKVE